MIRLNKTNTNQQFAITCSELGVLSNPFYLFVFTNDMTKDVQSVVLVDRSDRKDRYNLFKINGSFFLGEGWYSYSVYEQDNFNNTNPLLSTGLVETGRAFLVSSFDVKFEENNGTINFIENDGQ